jgi:hypothetical protein
MGSPPIIKRERPVVTRECQRMRELMDSYLAGELHV